MLKLERLPFAWKKRSFRCEFKWYGSIIFGKKIIFSKVLFFPIQPEFPTISVQYVDNLIPGSLRRHFREKNACLCLCRRTVLHGNSVSPCCLPLVYYYIILGMFLVCTFPFSFVCCILLYVCMFIILRRLIDKCRLSYDFECNLELPSTS